METEKEVHTTTRPEVLYKAKDDVLSGRAEKEEKAELHQSMRHNSIRLNEAQDNYLKMEAQGKEEKQRTTLQNKSLHLAFTQISRDMVEQGIDQKTILEHLKEFEVPVTPEFLKEVFKSIMFSLYRKTSTTNLTTYEMQECFDVLGKFLGEQFHYEAVWPSIETLMDSQLEQEKYQ